MNPSAVMPSSIGSSTRPTLRIWKKWSITQIESKPASSASRTMRANVGAMASGPPGQVNEGICRPTFMRGGYARNRLPAQRPAARSPGSAEQVHVRRDEAIADAPAAAPEARPPDQGDGPAGGLAEGQFGGRRQLVGHGADGRAHDPA